MMNQRALAIFTLFASLAVTPASGTTFSFTSILQAGGRGSGTNEIGTGASVGSTIIGTDYRYSNGTVGWSDNLDQQFRIGYNQATNTAYTTVWSSGGSATGTAYTSSYNPPGGVPLVTRKWTIGVSGLNLTADPAVTPNTSVQISQLRFQSGVNVVNPLQNTYSLTASQPGGSAQVGNTSPIEFSALGYGGSWYLDGVIRFEGLSPYASNGARDAELRFSLTATANDTPEPGSILLVSSGLFAMACWNRRGRGIILQ